MRGKYIKYIAAVLACMLMLCSCESMKSFTVKGTDGESITISVKTDGGYDLKHKGSDFDVLKDDKVILRGSIVNPDAWENFQQMMNSGDVEIVEQGDEKLVWKDGDKYNRLTMITAISYGLASGTVGEDGVTEEDIKAAMERLSYEWTSEETDDSLDL